MYEKPGVMIYFDLQETLDRLSDEQAGILFRAILEYGAKRTEPDLPDPLFFLCPLSRHGWTAMTGGIIGCPKSADMRFTSAGQSTTDKHRCPLPNGFASWTGTTMIWFAPDLYTCIGCITPDAIYNYIFKNTNKNKKQIHLTIGPLIFCGFYL